MMNNRVFKTCVGILVGSFIACSVLADNKIPGAPAWSTPARGINLENKDEAKDNKAPLFALTGSAKRYSQQQIDDKFNAPDWFPNQHGKMPTIVQTGKAPKVWACASCHLASGSGHPESASLAGLDSVYLQRQMHAFADGSRLDYSGHMNRMARVLNDAEIKEISTWFSTLTPQRVTQVIEVAQVPKTVIDQTRMRLVVQPVTMAAIGDRIIEIPAKLSAVKKRQPNSTFISYVPEGSIERGENLVRTGNGRTVPCAGCHGTDLRGSTLAPAIIANFASYTVRQLYGFKGNSRKGGQALMMQGVVNGLTDKDIIDISAYLSSLPVN